MRISATRCPCVRTDSAPTQRDRTSAPVCRASWRRPSHTSASQRFQNLSWGRQETERVTVGALVSSALTKITLPTPPPALFPQGPGTKLPTVTLKRPNWFAFIQTHTHTHSHSAQPVLIAPSYRFKRTRMVQWMYYMGFNVHQISICLKGILWTDLFYSVTPGNLIFRCIFHFIVFVVLFISLTWRASAN